MKVGEILRKRLTCNNDLAGDGLIVYPGDEACEDARAKHGLPPLTGQELPKQLCNGKLRSSCMECPELLELMVQSGFTTGQIPKSYVAGN